MATRRQRVLSRILHALKAADLTTASTTTSKLSNRLTMRPLRAAHLLVGLLFFTTTSKKCCARTIIPDDNRQYLFIGVSGGLQDGFPDHNKMDYHAGLDDEVRAIFIGRGVVRGTKAFLDVMEQGWRQYTDDDPADQPLINSVVMVSGCQEHANQYWIYAVDSRQFLTILNNEPRFLAITPDTGLVDLMSTDTDDSVRTLAIHEIQKQGATEGTSVAFPIVVATWYHEESFVPSPPVKIDADGTAVTNFPESLAKWAGVDDADRLAGCSDSDGTQQCTAEQVKAHTRYWNGIRKAVRHAEDHRLTAEERKSNGPPFQCLQKARLGVSPDHARINYPFSPLEIADIFQDAGYTIDFETAELTQGSIKAKLQMSLSNYTEIQ